MVNIQNTRLLGMAAVRTKVGKTVAINIFLHMMIIALTSYVCLPLESETIRMNQGRGSWTVFGPSSTISLFAMGCIGAFFNSLLTGACFMSEETFQIYQSDFFQLYNAFSAAFTMGCTTAVFILFGNAYRNQEAYLNCAAGGFGVLGSFANGMAVFFARNN